MENQTVCVFKDKILNFEGVKMRGQAKREIFIWIWRVIGGTISVPVIGEFVHNYNNAEGLSETVISLFMSLFFGFFSVFAAAFSNDWGTPGQDLIMYDIYSWCSCIFYAALTASLFIGMTSVEPED